MKQPSPVPDDLTGMSDEDLTDLAESIREEAESLAADAAKDDNALQSIEKLVAEFDRVNDEIDARAAREVERAERAAAALDRFHGGDTPGAEDPATEPVAEDPAVEPIAAATEVEAPEAPAVEVTEPVAAAAETTVEAAASPEPVEAPAETFTAEATEVEAPTPAPQEAAVTAPASPSTAVAALDAARPEALSPTEEVAERGAAFLATNTVPGVSEATPLTIEDLAKAITTKRHGMTAVSAGASERVTMATANTSSGRYVGGDEKANFAVFEDIRKGFTKDRAEETALVAAGGVCAPLEPSYEFFRLAEPINPVEGSLPVADAPRGGIRYITPPDFRDASGGVRVTTEAQDAAGYTTLDPSGPTAPKPCVRVECPPVEECRVDAVSQCVTFGNLNYRVFPEQVQAFLADLAVIFTQTKEIFYLDAIDANSTAVTVSPDYSAVRGITLVLLTAAANYRRRHHMPEGAVLSLYLPSWVVDFLKADMINDHSLGMNFVGATDAQVAAVFAGMNLDVTFYYDSATGAGQAFDTAQDEGPLNAFPEKVVAYLFAPGTFVRLNGGTLDVGLVRDSTLNSTNDLQLFSEEWIQVCMVGLESVRLEITTCPTGTAPEPVAPLECVGGSL